MVRRIATARSFGRRPAVLIEFDGIRKAQISHADLGVYDTPLKLRAEVERQASRAFPNLFFHINRDGSVAVAVGSASPAVWPEDEESPLDG